MKQETEDQSDTALGKMIGRQLVIGTLNTLIAFRATPRAGRIVAARLMRRKATKFVREGRVMEAESMIFMARKIRKIRE